MERGAVAEFGRRLQSTTMGKNEQTHREMQEVIGTFIYYKELLIRYVYHAYPSFQGIKNVELS